MSITRCKAFSKPKKVDIPNIFPQNEPILEKAEGITVSTVFRGGFDNNALEVTWVIQKAEHSPKWVGLKTFTGAQFQYVKEGQNSIIFAFAGDDAYCYCDNDPCMDCRFHCKKGFELFIGFKSEVLRIPL